MNPPGQPGACGASRKNQLTLIGGQKGANAWWTHALVLKVDLGSAELPSSIALAAASLMEGPEQPTAS